MSETKWTKGPWKFEEFPDSDGRGMGYVRPEDEDGMEISHIGDMARSTQENRANGHLHAAAPELYEALADLLRVDDKWHGSVNSEMAQCRMMARAALAKARGEA